MGLRQNLGQFSFLVMVNAFVVGFGFVKALTNLAAGRFSDRIGRKGFLVGGWIVGLPVPFLLMRAPSWGGTAEFHEMHWRRANEEGSRSFHTVRTRRGGE